MNANELFKNAKNGDQKSMVEIIDKNMGLIIYTLTKLGIEGDNKDDAIQEGIIGMIKAINKFDTARGHKFSTYATHWIKNEIIRNIIQKDRLVKVPAHARKDLDEKEDIPAHLLNIISLDEKHNTYEQLTKYDTVASDSFPDPKDLAFEKFENDKVSNILNSLSKKEKKVIILNLGFDYSLREIANNLDMSKEGIRKIKIRALKKLQR